MKIDKYVTMLRLMLAMAALFLGVNIGRTLAQNNGKKPQMPQMTPQQMMARRVTQAQRNAAAAALKAKKAKAAQGGAPAVVAPIPDPTGALVPDYFSTTPNWAFSPVPTGPITSILVTNGGSGYTAPVVTITDAYGIGTGATVTGTTVDVNGAITGITATSMNSYAAPVVTITDPTGVDATAVAVRATLDAGTGLRKFVDTLPVLPAVAAPDTLTYPGSDYYEIELVEYANWSFHASLPTTRLRGYKQTNNGTNPALLPCTPLPACANQIAPPATPSYLGPVVVATKDRPTRIKFTNHLPATAAGGNLFIPADTTVDGAGTGPDGTKYPENRGILHLHGGLTPWISDGTPHQWVTPATEVGTLKTGVSTQNVPDMPLPSGDSVTLYYTNQQSGRLMFYHDHALGITRLNVYAGEAAGYLLVDPVERKLTDGTTTVGATTIPFMDDIPLVIQDKTFVWGAPSPDGGVTPATGTFATDPTWNTAAWLTTPKPAWGQATGSLWFPHVYMTNQNPWDVSGANPMGRWDYALWFWPPYTGLIANPTVPNPYVNPAAPWEPPEIPGTPNPSLVPEAFMDTPIVNGKAYPTYTVNPIPYRFRILNASNDRFLNLSMFVAADNTSPTTAGTTGAVLCADNATVTPDRCTEVKMVPFNSSQNALTPFPSWWYTPGLNFTFDDRTGGVPDPTTRGPAMIQIGTEGGLLPAPAVIRNQPVNYTYNRKDIVVLSVQEHALLLGPAERADAIVDFTNFAGKTLILYNDAPAPIPAADQRLDYYTGGMDQTDTGGAPPTLPGYGPNTRTIMQIVVNGSGGSAPVDDVNPALLAALNTALPAAFAPSLDPIVVPQVAYNAAYPSSPTAADLPGANVSRIADNSLTFTPLFSTTPLTFDMMPKTIQELFETNYGRMNATLGIELKFTNAGNQTTIPFGYIDPATEIFNSATAIAPPQNTGDGTQIWKITHNGVDTHAIHFHLFNVQVINRVGWDGAIRKPDANELGWKETVRMNPLEDIIVAMRPTTPQLPFGLPDSVRPLDVTRPLGTTTQFSGLDANGNPVTVVNALTNFGWEYVWHCHLLGHEENDMMRPVVFNAPRLVPPAPTGVACNPSTCVSSASTRLTLTWTDPTPPTTSLGNPANEIGFRIERASVKNGKIGTWVPAVPAGSPATPMITLANAVTWTDTAPPPAPPSGSTWAYRVVAFNAAGSAPSSPTGVTPPPGLPADPTNLQAVLQAGPQVKLTWVDNSTNETSFSIERQVGAGSFSAIATVGANVTTYTQTTGVTAGNTYTYRVKAVNAAGSSGYAVSGPVPVLVPVAPTNFAADPVSVGKKNDSVVLRWIENSTNVNTFTIQSCPGATATCNQNGAVWTNVTTAIPTGTLAYQVTNVAKGSIFSYRIGAVNFAGISPWSNVIAVTFP